MGSKFDRQTQVRDSVQNSFLPFSKAHKSERKTKFQDQLAMCCQYFLKVHTVRGPIKKPQIKKHFSKKMKWAFVS